MSERHILVTNDDGIESPGLWKLAEVMAEFGRVLVVAPAAEASGSSAMVTYRRDIQIQEVPERIPGVRAYMVDGTPADCVLIGLRRLKEGWISVLAAGINPGPNLGADVFLSGTCGAAMMGAFRKITSMAISLDLEPVTEGEPVPRWDTGQAVARMLARAVDGGEFPEGAFLNVNIPALPLEEIKGAAITSPAPGGYMHLAEERIGSNERLQREIRPDHRHAHPGTDIRAVLDGYVSISPLTTALTHPAHLDELTKREDRLSAYLLP